MSPLAPTAAAAARNNLTTSILGIGTANPPSVKQEDTLEAARQMAGQSAGEQAWLARIFLRSGIDTRGSALAGSDDGGLEALRQFYPAGASPGTAVRMARYAAEAPNLAGRAAAAALDNAGVNAGAITHLITVSCTGFFAPGLDAFLIDHLGLSSGIRRLHVGFMGCHAAFNAMAAARDAVLANPAARVLVCCVELCTLHFAYGADPGKLVANALFADGAAALVMGRAQAGDGAAWGLRDSASLLFPDSLDAMTWTIGDHGFEMTLSPSVPVLIRQQMKSWCQEWLARHDLQIGDIASWAVHPGGPRILTAVAEALELDPQLLRFSRQILARHGNMSSATVLFILEQMAAEQAGGPCVAIGLGPGLTAEGMLLVR